MTIDKLAWAALQKGKTSRQIRKTAYDKADNCMFWLVAALTTLYVFSWEWALPPAALAAVNGLQWLKAWKLAPQLESLETLMRAASRG